MDIKNSTESSEHFLNISMVYKSEYRLWTIVVYFLSDFSITMITSDWRKSRLTAVKMS